jgi:hypothetical protein
MTVHILTTAFCNARVFRAGMQSLRNTVDFKALGAHHYVLDNHYPLHPGDTRFAIDTYAIAHSQNVTVVDVGKNLGLHEGLNHLLSKIILEDDDMVVAYDADEAPQTPGWVGAMLSVMRTDPKVGWLSLMAEVLAEALDKDNVPIVDVGGIRVRFPATSLMNCVVGWRGSMLKAIGKLEEPHAFYGGIEGAMQPKCREAGYSVGFMVDYYTKNHRGYADLAYEEYKLAHVGFTQPIFPGSFDEWLREKHAR